MSLPRSALIFGIIGLMVCACQAAPMRVAAASDLALCFESLEQRVLRPAGLDPVFTFGSSGQLATQISMGAPFAVFVSASSAYINEVVAKGACLDQTRSRFAFGRLALFSKNGPPGNPAGLDHTKYKRIAIANPDHAPYGMAAKEMLQNIGLWQAVKQKLVLGTNVRHALQIAETGNAEVAITALSLVLQKPLAQYSIIESSLHRPIEQWAVACNPGMGKTAEAVADQAGAKRFIELLLSEAGRATLAAYGFLPAAPEGKP